MVDVEAKPEREQVCGRFGFHWVEVEAKPRQEQVRVRFGLRLVDVVIVMKTSTGTYPVRIL